MHISNLFSICLWVSATQYSGTPISDRQCLCSKTVLIQYNTEEINFFLVRYKVVSAPVPKQFLSLSWVGLPVFLLFDFFSFFLNKSWVFFIKSHRSSFCCNCSSLMNYYGTNFHRWHLHSFLLLIDTRNILYGYKR